MADISLDEAIARIEGFLPRVLGEAVQIMQEEVPVRTGNLKAHVTVLEYGESYGVVGTEVDYARYVQNGRGEVRPKRAKALHWKEMNGADVFAMRSKPTKPNDFIGRTKRRLENTTFTL